MSKKGKVVQLHHADRQAASIVALLMISPHLSDLLFLFDSEFTSFMYKIAINVRSDNGNGELAIPLQLTIGVSGQEVPPLTQMGRDKKDNG